MSESRMLAATRVSSGSTDLVLRLAGVVGALMAAGLWVHESSLRRPLAALFVVVVLLVTISRDVNLGVGALFVFLSVLGLLRRLLIPDAAWTSQDALLLVAPAIVTVVAVQLASQGGLARTRLNKLCICLTLIAVLEAFNPAEGLSVGLGGLLFFVPPLFWYFLGTQTATRRTVERLMYGTILVALLNAVYGTIQSEIGLPSWDKQWVQATGSGLTIVGSIENAIRPVGSMSNAQEYLAVLAIGIVFSVALARRRPLVALAVPFLAAALFFGSGRSQFALAVLAVVIMSILRVLRGRAVVLGIVGAVALTLAAFEVAAPFLSKTAATSSNALVQHEATGLGNPFDQQDSTLFTHLSAFEQGVTDGVTHPLGEGTGESTIAADTLGNGGGRNQVLHDGVLESIRGTDTDVSNTFESFGLVGGIVYVVIIGMILTQMLRRYSLTRDDLILAVVGLFVAMTLQWLRGGLYAVSGLTWYLFGWATRAADTGNVRAVISRASPLRKSLE